MKRLAPILVNANNLGMLALARADLTAAMNADTVAASEITVGRQSRGHAAVTYHFLEIDPARDCGR